MPSHPTITGVIVVASIAVAAAVAIYESPQARQFSEDIRRKIALALHSLGDGINPESSSRSPRFNRPEDAEGFLQSKGRRENDANVNLDEESQRRQRDELIHWNAMKMAQEKDQTNAQYQEKNAYFTGASANQETEQGLRNRGWHSSISTDPLGDTHNIETNPLSASLEMGEKLYSVKENRSDIYSASDASASLVNVYHPEVESEKLDPGPRNTFGIPSQAEKEVYTSIHAWAESTRAESSPNTNPHAAHVPSQPSSAHSISSLTMPTSPSKSNKNINTRRSGDTTPTDLGSVAGSTRTISDLNFDIRSMNGTMSLSGESNTPGNWSEIGSVISEDDMVYN